MKKKITIDAREELSSGGGPLPKILDAAAALRKGEQLLVLAPFEPVPLFAVMNQQGFSHTARPARSGGWEVLFTRRSDAAPEAPGLAEQSRGPSSVTVETVEVDARGLEPPQPLVKILEALASLVDSGRLNARTDRRPMHLYAQLEDRGYTAETQEQPDGSFLTCVRRR